jgi:hypothetical protein
MNAAELVERTTGFKYYNELAAISGHTESRYVESATELGAFLALHAAKDPMLSTFSYRSLKEEFSAEISTRMAVYQFGGATAPGVSTSDILDGMAFDLKTKITDYVYSAVKLKSKTKACPSMPPIYDVSASVNQSRPKNRTIIAASDAYKDHIHTSCIHTVVDRFYTKCDGMIIYSSMNTDGNFVFDLPSDIEVCMTGIKMQMKVLPDEATGDPYIIASTTIDVRCSASLVHTY